MSTTNLPYKAIALDLDGTLLNEDKEVTEYSRRVLRHLHSLGVDIILASGRAVHLIEEVEAALGFDCYIIGYNGAVGANKRGKDGKKEMFFVDSLPEDRLDSLFAYAREKNTLLNVYLDIEYTLDDPSLRQYADHYASMTGAIYKFVPTYESLKPCKPAKCLLITEEESRCESLLSDCKSKFSDLSVIKSRCNNHEISQFYVEFLKKGSNKGSALQKFCAFRGITIDQIVAFGDAENDVHMIQEVGLGICMKGGTKCVVEVAKRITEYNNHEDGVAKELSKIYEISVA
eukprot:TRINITY_DN1410_c0_g1_i1.p1 TRINITY_DN1410_c0_g1~~TRINITY_DN1410_c0_g1_i1.p1  ORF type:complete len:288 (+),score=69.24 TRINITY_DN1410_c0_g1_i1:61-924(+)